MSDRTIQLIRTIVQALWGSAIGLGLVDWAAREAGLDHNVVSGAAVALSVALVVAVSQRLPSNRAGSIVSTALNGVNKPPAYTDPT